MDNIVLLYDKWKFNKPIPNCIKPEILSHIFVTDRLIDSFELENKFGNQHSSWISNLGIKDIKLEITDNIESENWDSFILKNKTQYFTFRNGNAD